MAERKMTIDERRQFFEQLLAYENAKAECEERKANAMAEFNKELKGYEMRIDHLRQQLNSGTVEYDPQLKLQVDETDRQEKKLSPKETSGRSQRMKDYWENWRKKQAQEAKSAEVQ